MNRNLKTKTKWSCRTIELENSSLFNINLKLTWKVLTTKLN